MLGKPHWFRRKRFGWGLVPIAPQGWLYTLIWSLVIVLPYLLLIARHSTLEAIVWISATIAALCWDVRLIMREMPPPSSCPPAPSSRRPRSTTSPACSAARGDGPS